MIRCVFYVAYYEPQNSDLGDRDRVTVSIGLKYKEHTNWGKLESSRTKIVQCPASRIVCKFS